MFLYTFEAPRASLGMTQSQYGALPQLQRTALDILAANAAAATPALELNPDWYKMVSLNEVSILIDPNSFTPPLTDAQVRAMYAQLDALAADQGFTVNPGLSGDYTFPPAARVAPVAASSSGTAIALLAIAAAAAVGVYLIGNYNY